MLHSISSPSIPSARALAPGDHEFALEHQARQRTYLVHVPPQVRTGQALPVVLSFHGGGGRAIQHQWYTCMDPLADQAGFLAVYPNGAGRWPKRLLTWNAGECCGYSQKYQIDDVGFVRALLSALARATPIDPARIYATGLSNGAMMAYRLAVEAADQIAAIAPVAGGMVVDTFTPSRPVPVIHFHSVDDPRALYQGGLGPPFPLTRTRVNHPNVEQMLVRWITYNGCPEQPVVAATLHGQKGSGDEGHSATKYVYGPGREAVEVVFWKLTGAGHVWPGGQPHHLNRLLGPSTDIINANVEMWQFFSRFSL